MHSLPVGMVSAQGRALHPLFVKIILPLLANIVCARKRLSKRFYSSISFNGLDSAFLHYAAIFEAVSKATVYPAQIKLIFEYQIHKILIFSLQKIINKFISSFDMVCILI